MPLPEGQGITSRGVFCRVFINVSRETHTKMIAVIDYGMENLRSIRNALMMVKIAHALTIVLLSCVFAQYVVSLQCVWLKKRSTCISFKTLIKALNRKVKGTLLESELGSLLWTEKGREKNNGIAVWE